MKFFVLEMAKEISGWSKHPSADTSLALKATKMLQYIVFTIVFLNEPSIYQYQKHALVV